MKIQYCYPTMAMRICIDNIEESRIRGNIYCPQMAQAIPFDDMGSLIIQMEQMLDLRGYPLAFQQKRNFLKTRQSEEGDLKLLEEEAQIQQRIAELQQVQGERLTCVAYITSRQNATWQGRMEWIENGKTDVAPFRSALEFIKFMDYRVLKMQCPDSFTEKGEKVYEAIQ